MQDLGFAVYRQVQYPVKRATFSLAGGANATVVAAVAGKKIVVIGGLILMATSTTITFRSTTSTAITPTMNLLTAPVLFPTGSGIICETVAGQLLDIIAGANAIQGILWYIEV